MTAVAWPARRMLSLDEPRGAGLALVAFLATHVVVWTVVATLFRASLDRYGDMTENFVWGQEWLWGYHKHPPLFAWITAAWFEVFPNTNWAYFTLTQVNVAVGLAAIYAIARELLSPRRALVAVMLMELAPAYTFVSFKFNANTILLSMWPLTAWLALLAVTRGRRRHWIGLGLLAGCAMLGKYYSGVLLAAILVYLLATPAGRRAFASPGPWLALVAFAAVLTPHVSWLVGNDFLPVRYAAEHVEAAFWTPYRKAIKFLWVNFQYIAPMLLACLVLVRRAWFVPAFVPRPGTGDTRALLGPVLTVVPLAITLFCALVLRVKISSPWGLPLWFLVSTVIVSAYGTEMTARAARRATGVVIAAMVVVPLVILTVAARSDRIKDRYSFPVEPLASAITERWRAAHGTPLRLVAGCKVCAYATAFYSPDHPSVLIDFDPAISPWVTSRRLREEGIALVCPEEDGECRERAARLAPAAAPATLVTAASESLFRRSPERRFVYWLVAPGRP